MLKLIDNHSLFPHEKKKPFQSLRELLVFEGRGVLQCVPVCVWEEFQSDVCALSYAFDVVC